MGTFLSFIYGVFAYLLFGHLLFAVILTLYIFIVVEYLEEKALRKDFGKEYEAY